MESLNRKISLCNCSTISRPSHDLPMSMIRHSREFYSNRFSLWHRQNKHTIIYCALETVVVIAGCRTANILVEIKGSSLVDFRSLQRRIYTLGTRKSVPRKRGSPK